MADLQRESDTAFADPADSTIQQQAAVEAAAAASAIQFADEPGADEYPAPTPLVGDGRGSKRAVDNLEFADGGNEPELLDPESLRQAPQRQPRSLDDLHAHAEERPSAGREEFDPRILARARNYGLTEAQVRGSYGSREQLENALLAFDQQGLNQFRWWRQQQQQGQQMAPQPAPVQPPPQAPAPPPPPATGLTEEELKGLEYQLKYPEAYDETYVEDIRGMNKHVADQFRKQQEHLRNLESLVVAQQQRITQWEQAQQAELQRKEVEDFDQTIRSLGGDWEAVFGSEPYETLPQGDPRLVNRAQAWGLSKELQLFHASMHRHYISPADVLPSSLNMTFPDSKAVAGRPKPIPPRDTRTGRFLAVPTGRTRREGKVNTREEMLRKVDRFFASRGFPGDYGTEGGIADI